VRLFNQTIIVLTGLLAGGCLFKDNTPSPPRASVPPPMINSMDQTAAGKPLMQRGGYDASFDDTPIVTQPPPEQAAFVQAYTSVGSPRLAVYVNRTVDATPVIASGASVQRIDFQAVENVMTDWLAAGGQVTLVSPVFSQSLSANPQQAQVLSALPKESGIDVLIYIQAQEVAQADGQRSIRMVAEAINTRRGESLARALLDPPTMLDKPVINDETRFLARKLMNDMTRAWQHIPATPATTQSNF
jgi:hypothetical protein